MIGKTISHYIITAKLGAGGMGEVYLAEDTTLKRKVALKFLPKHFRRDHEARARFRREAEALAALHHPNVVTVHEIGEHDGQPFIVMEYVDGVALTDHRIDTNRPTGALLSLVIEVAEGLGRAHQAGIIHRDLKPSNVVVDREGHARILDFGLAKISGATKLTHTHSTLGTVSYMSPEQAQGRDADHRSDLFSLGVILYELLTGRLPFAADHEAAIVYAIVNEQPEPLARYKSGIPDTLQRIIDKCLNKKPESRYQSAADLLVDLRAARDAATESKTQLGTEAPRTAPSIAVLPFANMSDSPDNEYFSDGLAEELIGALAKVRGLQVVARTSSFAFKGQSLDVREIGRTLNVGCVLEGGVRRAGNRLRITAQLIDVADGYHLWSERYDREMTDVFAVQDDIAQTIVRELGIHLSRQESEDLVPHVTTDLDAYNLYLEARFHVNKLTRTDQEKAIGLFNQAIARDPGFGLAYAGLAYAHCMGAIWENFPTHDVFARAREAARKALQIDDGLAEAHNALGIIHMLYDWDWDGAERELHIALDLDPGSALTHVDYSLLLMVQRRFAEAVTQARLAQKLDPLSTMINGWVGKILAFAGRRDEAVAQLQKVIALDPGYWHSYFMLSFVRMYEGQIAEALEAARTAVNLSAELPIAVMFLTCACYLAGRNDEAESLLERLIERSEGEYIPATFFCWINLARGDIDEAYACFARALQERECWLSLYRLVPVQPPDEPRFRELIRQIGLES